MPPATKHIEARVSRPCTLPEQHNRVNLVITGVDKSSTKLWAWGSTPHFSCLLVAQAGNDNLLPTHQCLKLVGELVLWSYELKIYPWLPPAAILRSAGLALPHCNTIEPTLFVQTWVSPSHLKQNWWPEAENCHHCFQQSPHWLEWWEWCQL